MKGFSTNELFDEKTNFPWLRRVVLFFDRVRFKGGKGVDKEDWAKRTVREVNIIRTIF